MEMLGNVWSDTDGLGSNSFVFDFNAFSPSSSGHRYSHVPDLQGDLERKAVCGDGQDSSLGADFILADLLHICTTPDQVTADYGGGFSSVVAQGSCSCDAPTNAMLSKTPSQRDVQLEGCGEGMPFFADFRLPSTCASEPGASVGEVSPSQYAEEPSNIIPGLQGPINLPAPTCTLSWHQPPAGGVSAQTAVTVASSMELQENTAREEVGAAQCTGQWPASASPFMDLSEFVSPQLASSRHLSAEQLACLGMHNFLFRETAHGGASTAFGGLAKPRINVEEPLRHFPVTLSSVQQDRGAKVSSNRSTSRVQQVWKSSKLPPNKSNSASSDGGPKGMPVNPLAPVTPERQRKRRTHLQRQLDYHCAPLPSKPRKLQKLGPVPEPDSVFEQVRLMHTHFVGIQGGHGNSFVGGNASSTLVPVPKGVVKAGDHVARERRRRDLMNTRYQSLESLLPPLPCRRDRFLIVEDTKLYVKEMEQRLSDLNRRRRDCQTQLEAAQVAKQRLQQGKEKAAVEVPVGGVKTSPLAGFVDSSMSQDLNVEVVIDQTDQQHGVLVFAQCRSSSGAKLLSSLLRAIEKLQLDVSQCSISKSSQSFFCSAVCKVQKHVVRSSLSSEKVIQELVTTLSPALKVEGSTLK